MTMQPAVQENRRFFEIADDLAVYEETLAMLECRMAEGPPDEERADIQRDIAEVNVCLERIRHELANKTDALAAVIERLGVEQDFLHAQRDRLKAKEQATERAREGLRDYAVRVMLQNGIRRLKTPTNTLFLRETKAVEILDANLVPPEFQNAEVKLPLWLWHAILQVIEDNAPDDVASGALNLRVKAEPSLSTIRKAIESGVDVEGADMRLSAHLVCR
jgi:hypothetical protein